MHSGMGTTSLNVGRTGVLSRSAAPQASLYESNTDPTFGETFDNYRIAELYHILARAFVSYRRQAYFRPRPFYYRFFFAEMAEQDLGKCRTYVCGARDYINYNCRWFACNSGSSFSSLEVLATINMV